jgi:hypothetical protein
MTPLEFHLSASKRLGKSLEVSVPSAPPFPNRVGNKFFIEESTVDSYAVSNQFWDAYKWFILVWSSICDWAKKSNIETALKNKPNRFQVIVRDLLDSEMKNS